MQFLQPLPFTLPLSFKGISYLLLLAVCTLPACFKVKENGLELQQTEAKSDKPKNIIFIIGDGMALSQVSASVVWERNQSWFEKFEAVGFHKSASLDNLVTDSAAGATAFACGVKTKNNYTGVDGKKQTIETIIERAKKQGFAAGMLVTSSVTHATPAAFAAHTESRAYYDEIAASMLKTPIDCVIGGGSATFQNNPNGFALKDSLFAKGYFLKNDFNNPKSLPDSSRAFYLFTAENEPPTVAGGRKYLPILAPLTADYLKKTLQKRLFSYD